MSIIKHTVWTSKRRKVRQTRSRKLRAVAALFAIAMAFSSSSFAVVQGAQPVSAHQLEWQTLGVTAKISKIFPTQLKAGPTLQDRYLLNVDLGHLSQVQFSKLAKNFGGLSHVTYSSDQDYNLIDFLPPVMQALVNKLYNVEQLDLDKLGVPQVAGTVWWGIYSNGIYASANCISTVYEVTRLMASAGLGAYELFGADRDIGEGLLNLEKINKEDLRFGDLVVYSTENDFSSDGSTAPEVQHTVIFLTPNIVFEKTDSDTIEPYRLSLRSDVESRLRADFPGKGELHISYRRGGATAGKFLKRLETSGWMKEFSQATGTKLVEIPSKLRRLPLALSWDKDDVGNLVPYLILIKTIDITIDPKSGRGVEHAPAGLFENLLY